MRRASLLLGLFVSCALAVAAAPPARAKEAPAEVDAGVLRLSAELAVTVRSGREIELLVQAASGEGYEAIAGRVGRSEGAAEAIREVNGTPSPPRDRPVRVPLRLLRDDYRALVLSSLFPRDRIENGDWIHVARSGALPVVDEGLWQVAEWFHGDGARFREIAKANGLGSPELTVGQEVRIPAALLHPALRPGTPSDDALLVFREDERGPYAGYRLRPGEALYSAVVVRFTGRTAPDDVNAVAAEVAARSGIHDVTDVPAGFVVKIPLDLLEPEFLPKDHPRRKEVEEAKRELLEELDRTPIGRARAGLEGVVVILDPGHGGTDVGTTNHGISERDYVYDVAARLGALLERTTAARVFQTIENPGVKVASSSNDRVERSRRGRVATDPPFTPGREGDSSVGVNLRWYLANSILSRSEKEGIDPDRTVFLSLHADARHPGLRGVMAYVPGVSFRGGSHGFRSGRYMRYREVRERPVVRFTRKEMVRSEAVSRKLASCIVDAFAAEGLPVQPFKPVRDRVIRGRKTWLPAVLRGNAVPAKVLVEMVNMSNPKDAAVLASAEDRDRIAAALARALAAYFGEAQSGRPSPAGASR